jgi:hypothetical protein
LARGPLNVVPHDLPGVERLFHGASPRLRAMIIHTIVTTKMRDS